MRTTPSVRPAWLVIAMVLAVAADLAFERTTHDVTPGLFLLPAVIAVAVAAGPTAGFAAAAFAVAFAAVDLSEAGPLWRPPYAAAVRLAVLAVSAPLAAGVVGLLRRRVIDLQAERVQSTVRSERSRADARCAADAATHAAERAALQRQRDQLADADRQTQRRLADLVAAVPGVVWEVAFGPDATPQLTFVSDHVQRLLGYPADHFTAGPVAAALAVVHPDDVATLFAQFHHGLTTAGRTPEPFEFRCVAADGDVRWLETRVVPVAPPAEGNGPVGLRGVAWDTTARHELEADLRGHAAELTATARQLRDSNAELDQFAYVASHDLKAPLRGIANLSNWIEEDLGDARITPEAHAQFELLRGRVHRMERLIDALLTYSQVGRTAGTVEWVSVDQLMTEVADWIGPPPHLRLDVDPGLPAFNADRVRLSQVLNNLVGNAVKHHGATPGWVRVSGRAVDPDTFEFAVADDGPGIDPRYHERIFGVFQTLRPRDQVEGTGIGLALIRKIVTGKGGTVTVDSALGRGATFRFTWPRVDPAAFANSAAAVPPAPSRFTPAARRPSAAARHEVLS